MRLLYSIHGKLILTRRKERVVIFTPGALVDMNFEA